eukprot:GFYU01001050.1.p2 GENE.GFYU01001050.1~~GFYU01001050.1.p2  ORF type:complete len:192 (-),score=80.49 GFYU01001050.1:41-616(-)
MKELLVANTITFPDDVKVQVKSRKVTVTGPRGTITKVFKHLQMDMLLAKDGRSLKFEIWGATGKQQACVRTVSSHILNMCTGVTKGYLYKMRFVYAHFPVNTSITDDKKRIEIRNFLGEKVVRGVDMLPGVTIERSAKVKDEIILQGNDIENVSQSAANIHQICHVKNKDIRKFLDGVYVSEKTNVIVPEE